MKRVLFALATALAVTAAFPAQAEEGVTLVLKSGVILFLRDGYKQIVPTVKAHPGPSAEAGARAGRWLELNLDGHPFLVDLNEVAIVCRERCDSMTIIRPAVKAQPEKS
jgi:hypothetical protein